MTGTGSVEVRWLRGGQAQKKFGPKSGPVVPRQVRTGPKWRGIQSNPGFFVSV
ncbi:hypothetical protein B0H67DRAFT_571198 [Lasiosphaeris hirsuta]|uniref:Uncharacterized protein n=1 Tax=Lasiosphaeris hirsuta TaxID=260670 RepID=A0AA40E5F2_9PEZI|nr:hypothetical protein B0H67DRAFT_571198 [Lasiosphaeris hirsuta]